eukprot:2285114-Rhodomonas_salina.1
MADSPMLQVVLMLTVRGEPSILVVREARDERLDVGDTFPPFGVVLDQGDLFHVGGSRAALWDGCGVGCVGVGGLCCGWGPCGIG